MVKSEFGDVPAHDNSAVALGGIAALRAAIKGPVLSPDDAAYADECRAFNLLRGFTPPVTVGATCAADVAAAVRYANESRLSVAVRNRGHQVVLPADDKVMLITTNRLQDIAVNAGEFTVRVGAGVTWSQVLAETERFGLAPIAGSAPEVGVVGYTLGGGLSPLLGRTLGYAADHVRWIEVVTADGVVRHVTPDSEGDLFWALLGGKGNFGVVTRIEFSVFPVTRFYGGGLWFHGEDMGPVLETWRTLLPALKEETTTSFAVQRLPDISELPEQLRGEFVVHIRWGHLGDAGEGARIVEPLRAAATPIFDTLADRPFRKIGEIHVDPVEPMPYVETGLGLREFSDETLVKFIELTGPDSGCPMKSVEIRALGGALDREPDSPNAVPSRELPFLTFAVGGGSPEELSAAEKFIGNYADGLAPWIDPRNVVNFVSPDESLTEAGVRDIYGAERYERLSAAKRAHDPANLFRFNHNIRPSA